MSQAHDQDGVPPDLARLFPGVGADLEEDAPFVAEGLGALHATLDAEGPSSAVSSLPTRVRWGLALGLVAGVVTMVLLGTRRADFEVYPRGRMLLDLGLLLGPLVLALVAALRPLSRPALSTARRVQWVALGLLCLAVSWALPAAHALHPASQAGVGPVFWAQAGSCFVFGLSFAAFAALALGLLSRNGPTRWFPSALGVWAAGLTGLVALYLHCPITELGHLCAGHSTVAVPVLALVLLLRGRVDG
ncbi:MAG: hypothetical protein ACE37F_24270 [Nannocystaceae bacterium]|nr:hypothetical protein [bacterium]